MTKADITRLYLGDRAIWESPALTQKVPDLRDYTQATTISFKVGDRIELTRTSNIRSAPQIATNTLRGINLRGWRGTITGGPQPGPNGTAFFDIEFDRGAWDGWVIHENLKIATDVVIRTPDYFKVGDSVRLFRSANVRNAPAINRSSLIGTNPPDSVGTIKEGPRADDARNIWYNIDFKEGRDGWVVSDNLELENQLFTNAPPPLALSGKPSETYKQLLIKSERAFRTGLPGSWPEQFMHALDRSISNPNVIVAGQDVSQFWRSLDNSKTWQHAPCRGLVSRWSASVRIHPRNAGFWVAAMTSPSGRPNNGYGLYVTSNYGDDWKFVLKPAGTIVGSARPNSLGTGRKTHRHCRWLISFDYSNPNTVYFANPYDGLYKSTNGGSNWSRITTSSFNEMQRIFHIEVHPQNSNIIYFAAENGFFRSTNGGQTISKVGTGLPGATGINGDWKTSMSVNPQNGNDVHVVVYRNGVYQSTNGGASFTRIYADNGAAHLAIHRVDRNVMYLARRGANLIYSTNGGRNWNACSVTANNLGWDMANWKQSINAPSADNQFAENSLQLGILPHPTDPDQAYAHSSAVFYKTSNKRQWINGGVGFCSLAWGHGNSGNIAFDMQNHNRFMIFCFDEGSFITETGGNYWEHRNSGSQGTGKGGQYVGSFCPGNPDRIISTVGLYSNPSSITISYDRGRTWFAPLSGNANRQITWASWHTQNQNIVYCDTFRSTNGGRNFTPWGAGFPAGGRACAVARSNGDIVYAVASDGRRIYRSANAGVSWSLYFTAPRSLNSLQRITPFEVDPKNPNIIYVSSASNGVLKYDGTRATELGLSGNGISSIKVDARYPSIIYAKGGGNGRSFLWRTTNAGQSWLDISYNLPRTEANRNIEVHPLTGDLLVGGTVGTRILPPPYNSPNSLYGKF